MPRSQVEEFDPELFLRTRLEALPASDLLVFSLGGFLGWHGYTPLTALLGVARGAFESVGQAVQRSNDALQQASSALGIDLTFVRILPTFPLAALLTGLLAPQPVPTQASGPDIAKYELRILNAAIGALEAYALTRPGTIGGILQGIGEIVPL